MNETSQKAGHLFGLDIVSLQSRHESRPSDAVVSAFRQHLEATGDPSTFPGIVTTKPPEGAKFVFLAYEMSLLVRHRRDGLRIPCPWCSPTAPKFAKGRLLWFPDECVLRFVGWRCAKSHLDDKQLAAAEQQWKDEQQRASTNQFLRDNCARVAELFARGQRMLAPASAADKFFNEFASNTVENRSEMHSIIAHYVRGGELFVDVIGSNTKTASPIYSPSFDFHGVNVQDARRPPG